MPIIKKIILATKFQAVQITLFPLFISTELLLYILNLLGHNGCTGKQMVAHSFSVSLNDLKETEHGFNWQTNHEANRTLL